MACDIPMGGQRLCPEDGCAAHIHLKLSTFHKYGPKTLNCPTYDLKVQYQHDKSQRSWLLLLLLTVVCWSWCYGGGVSCFLVSWPLYLLVFPGGLEV